MNEGVGLQVRPLVIPGCKVNLCDNGNAAGTFPGLDPAPSRDADVL